MALHRVSPLLQAFCLGLGMVITSVAVVAQPTVEADREDLLLTAKRVGFALDGADVPVYVSDLLDEIAALKTRVKVLEDTSLTNETAAVKFMPRSDLATSLADLSTAVIEEGERVFADKDDSAELAKRVDDVMAGVADLRKLRPVVVQVVKDVNYLQGHAANVTKCHEDGELHAGDGECLSAINTCGKLSANKNAKVTGYDDLPEIIPGVVARTECAIGFYPSKGDTARTCLRSGGWDGADVVCAACVGGCTACSSATTCTACKAGLILNLGKCLDFNTIYFFSGLSSNAGGHHLSWEQLTKTSGFKQVLPSIPLGVRGGFAAVLGGEIIYGLGWSSAGADGKQVFSLPIKGGTKWREVAGPGFDQVWPFYGTVNEKLYLLGGAGKSAVYDGKRWRALPGLAFPRSRGATAVIGTDIYCIGGIAGRLRYDTIEVFSTVTESFSVAPFKLPGKRFDLGAAGIGGKLFVFGGVDPDDKFTTDTLMLDVGAGSKTWKTLSPMSRGMAEFGYAARMINGKWEIYVGGVYRWAAKGSGARLTGGTKETMVYDVSGDSWSEGPPLSVSRGVGFCAVGPEM